MFFKLCLQYIAEISNRMKPKLPKIQTIVLQISYEFWTLYFREHLPDLGKEILYRYIRSIFYNRHLCSTRGALGPPDSPVRSHALYYILTHFIAKSNAFMQFYRKNQCVSLFETKTKVFSQTANQVLPTSCRVQVWTYSLSLLPTKSDFQPTFLGILPNYPQRIFVLL